MRVDSNFNLTDMSDLTADESLTELAGKDLTWVGSKFFEIRFRVETFPVVDGNNFDRVIFLESVSVPLAKLVQLVFTPVNLKDRLHIPQN